MFFCPNCGKEVSQDSNFCPFCGSAITKSNNQNAPQRKTFFEGEIHKCPNCGEILNSFDAVCPACNFELRGINGSKAIKSLSEKLELADTDKKRINIIKNFPIPNTKEDIFEFFLLASSNFDIEYYTSHLEEEDIADAWLTKIEQCYQKAKIFLSSAEIEKIENIYREIKSKIKKSLLKKKKVITNSIILIVVGLLLVLTQFLPIATIGLVLLIVGIVRLATRKKKSEEKQDKISVGKKGFSSWSTGAKILWIILNVYTIGIPAIIYACYKKI